MYRKFNNLYNVVLNHKVIPVSYQIKGFAYATTILSQSTNRKQVGNAIIKSQNRPTTNLDIITP